MPDQSIAENSVVLEAPKSIPHPVEQQKPQVTEQAKQIADEIEGEISQPVPNPDQTLAGIARPEGKGIRSKLEHGLSSLKQSIFPHETEEALMEKFRIEFKIKEKLNQWLSLEKAQLEERSSHFGIDAEKAGKNIDDIMLSFSLELVRIQDNKEFAKIKKKARELFSKVRDPDAKLIFQSKLALLTQNSLLELISRKLDGNVTDEEKDFLDGLSTADTGKTQFGTYDCSLKRIGLPLLNSADTKRYLIALHHEFTHFGLDHAVPDAVAIEDFANLTKLESGTEKVHSMKEDRLFAASVKMIDESIAHRAGAFFGGGEPYCETYEDRIVSSLLFRRVYKTIDSLAEGKTLGQFDEAATHLYKSFVDKWKENLTEADMHNITSSFIEDATKMTSPAK